ncbi:hypothetical protein AMJ87_10440 [candidate division WOR_3 bacterium SM23_60]|uniref:Uncharacterized protein n=1 Tax=candidate division WOR_3 bacterium SM23_60 TaxID=1703780 RepID=A0A0S8G904_UNCW3|nr:MAG: hypothetical protein AMJ87_10440 [candidate division WOR_3 bacterium SM23_60]
MTLLLELLLQELYVYFWVFLEFEFAVVTAKIVVLTFVSDELFFYTSLQSGINLLYYVRYHARR